MANPVTGTDLSPEQVRELEAEIRELKREKDAVILAHNYQLPEIQGLADVVGDSLQLAIEAQKVPQSHHRLLRRPLHGRVGQGAEPRPRRVLLPNLSAGCSLADSISAESLEDWKERYPGHAVVTYVNSTAEVKALSDICCTSANAASVVRSLPREEDPLHPRPQPGGLGEVEGAGEGDRGLRRRLPDPRRAAQRQRGEGARASAPRRWSSPTRSAAPTCWSWPTRSAPPPA